MYTSVEIIEDPMLRELLPSRDFIMLITKFMCIVFSLSHYFGEYIMLRNVSRYGYIMSI